MNCVVCRKVLSPARPSSLPPNAHVGCAAFVPLAADLAEAVRLLRKAFDEDEGSGLTGHVKWLEETDAFLRRVGRSYPKEEEK